MPFIALCPHCRDAKVSAPTRKQGTLHDCPKCKTPFTLEPMGVNELPVDYKLPPPEFDIAKAYAEAPRDDFATAPTVVARALTNSEILPIEQLEAEAKKANSPAKPSVNEPAADDTPNETLTGDIHFTLVLVGFGIFGLAMLATQFAYGRFVALPLLVAGIVCGLTALPGMTGREKFSYGVIGTNVLGLVLVLLLPDWLGLRSWTPLPDPNAEPKPVFAVRKDGSSRVPALDAIDAFLNVWEQDDVRVEIASAVIGMLDADTNPAPRDLKEKKDNPPVLRLTVRVRNVGVARQLPLAAFGGTPETTPTLAVADGSALAFLKMETPPPAPVPMGKDVEQVLLFAVPKKDAGLLRLDLPGAVFGLKPPIGFTLPAMMIATPNAFNR